MNKLLVIILLFFVLLSCGGIKDLNYGEPFTTEEKNLFSKIFNDYVAKDNNNNEQLQITSSIGDSLITIEGYYNPPYYPSRYEYRFTKENGKFICRTFVNEIIEARDENSNFEVLLKQILRLY